MPYRQEVRREVWKITEWRDGCVFGTQSLGLIWLPLDKLTWDTSMRPGETFEQAWKRNEEEHEAHAKIVGDYEAQVAKEHGGDFLGSPSTSLPYEETMRSVKE